MADEFDKTKIIAALRAKGVSDKEIEKLYGKLGFLTLIPDGRSKPVPADFTIVYGVLRHPNARTKSLALPFFSKIALRAVAERLDLMGFKVELHQIAKV